MLRSEWTIVDSGEPEFMQVGQTFCQVASPVSRKKYRVVSTLKMRLSLNLDKRHYCVLNLYNGFLSLGIIGGGEFNRMVLTPWTHILLLLLF